MAKVTKKIGKHIEIKSQNFSNLDASEGDVLMVKDSLGKPASFARFVTKNGALKVRFNVYQTIFPHRPADGLHAEYAYNMMSGQEYKLDENEAAEFTIETDTAYELNKAFPIKDVELVTVSGTWDLLVA